MFGEKAYLLVKELDRNRDTIAPYNIDLIKEIRSEITQLFQQNQEDASTSADRTMDDMRHFPTVRIRHSAVKRNLRCILAYSYNRLRCLRVMRWEFGSILPPDVKVNLNGPEVDWFSKYSSMLATYMRSIGDDGIDLSLNLKPPKTLYIEVRCLADYGRYELSDGTVVLLKENTRHYLPRHECEEFIRQGVLEHVLN